MTDFLPKEVQAGLDAARKKELRKKNRLRVRAGDETFRVLKFRDDGFTLDVEEPPHLRGFVDLYDGARHLYQCLVVASAEEDGEMFYEFKRATAASDKPPLDFYRDEDAPAGL
jgi:hypothetical protein